MNKRIAAVVAMVLILGCMCIPAAAGGIDGGELAYNTYYALIPYCTMAVRSGYVTYNYAAQGQTYMRTSAAFDYGETGYDHTYMPMTINAIGWVFEDGNTASQEPLEGGYRQVYYSQGSSYYATTNEWTWKAQVNQVSMTASGFGMTLAMYDTLESYAYLNLPAGTRANVSVTAVYYSLSDDGSEWWQHTNTVTKSITATSAGNYTYYPADVFRHDLNYPGGNIPVAELTISIQFPAGLGTSAKISMGMLYGRKFDGMSLMADTVATITVDNIIEVPAEDLNLFNWLIEPIGAFFGIELFPGVSLGAIIGIFVVIALVLIYLKFFAGG